MNDIGGNKRKYRSLSVAAPCERQLPPLMLWEAAYVRTETKDNVNAARQIYEFDVEKITAQQPDDVSKARLTAIGFSIEKHENAEAGIASATVTRRKRRKIDAGERGHAFTSKTNGTDSMFKRMNDNAISSSASGINAD